MARSSPPRPSASSRCSRCRCCWRRARSSAACGRRGGRARSRRIVDARGAAPALLAWLLAIGLDALALAWLAFQGIWTLSNHTAFKVLSVSFAEPAIVVAAALGLVALTGPVVRVFTWLFGELEAEWQRGSKRALLTPWRIALGIPLLTAVVGELVWRLVIKPKIGPFDTAPFDAPLVAVAVWAACHPLAAVLAPRARAIAAAACGFVVVATIGAALYAEQTEPGLTLAIWGERPLAGEAIELAFDLDDIRAEMSLAAFVPVERPDSPHPDIVLVTIDTVRADHTPPYNTTTAADMPVLRQLGNVGVVFDWAFSPSNVTRRSIPSLAIGLQPNRVRGRVVGWALRVDPRHVLLAERLQAAGYDTAGFMCCKGFWGDEFHTGLQRGLDHLELETNGYELARRARVWLDARERSNPGKPLFLWMHLLEPHNWTVASGEGRNDAERRQLYDRTLSQSDAALGELLNAFSHRAPAKAPIVIVTADHGEGLGDHNHPFHSTDLYDSQTHVPLVLAGPGIKPRHVAETVSLTDLVPTILELAGYEVPTGSAIDGRSIADLASGRRGGDAEQGEAYAAMIQDRSNPGGIEMLVKGRYKLIEADGVQSELYDTRTDPDEHFNLYFTHQGVVALLHKMLEERRARAEMTPFE
jgi:arylsulfatase A-like enzyme